jgi:hypothetical protein
MSQKTTDAISRSDRVLVAAAMIILATASAAIGASLTARPYADKVAVAPAPAAVVRQVAVADIAKPAADSVMTQLLAEHKCLSEVLYYEARGEGAGGQKAIAEVVFHRMNHGNYGHSICAVVYEGAKRSGCQFSFACNGDMKRSKQQAAWRQADGRRHELPRCFRGAGMGRHAGKDYPDRQPHLLSRRRPHAGELARKIQTDIQVGRAMRNCA